MLRGALAGVLAGAAVSIALPGMLPTGVADEGLPACSRPGGMSRMGDWVAAKAPRFVERLGGAAQQVSTYAVDPNNPKRVFVTNGTSLVKSLDGGCTWNEIFAIPETPDDVTPFAASTTRITEIVVPEDEKYREAVFLLAQESTDAGGRPHVLYARSAKRGKFEVRDSGLPPAGRGHDLTVGVTNSDFQYLAVDSVDAKSTDLGAGVSAPLGGLYASTDGAESWTRRTPVTEQRRYDALAIDPGSGNGLWAVESGHLRHTKDGGRTFAAPAPDESTQAAAGWQITALSIARPPRHGPVVHAYSRTSSSGRPVELVLDDDGSRVRTAPAPGPVETAAIAYDGVTALVSTRAEDGRPARVHVRVPGGSWADITPLRTTRDLQVSTDRSGAPQVRAVTDRAVVTYAKQIVPPPPPLPPPTGAVADPGRPGPVGPPSLSPAVTALTLQADETRDVDYLLQLPHRPVPLDLYFLVDSSESMTDNMPDVRRDALALVSELRATGVDVWAGLGYYKTDCRAPAYRRELAVGPTDDPDRLRRALDVLDTSDAPGLETQLFALDQAVTGSGARVVPPPPPGCGLPTGLPSSQVPAGQDAGFREAALKVVVHVADITFRRPWCDPNPALGCTPPQLTPTKSDGSPDLRPAAQDFLERGVLSVGVAADRDGLSDLREFAALTRTTAPAGGVDCDGDGAADLTAGSPFVCGSSARLADPLRRRLAQVSVRRAVQLVASSTGAMSEVTPRTVPNVDVTRDLALPVTATYSCKGRDPGTYPTALAATLTGGPVVEQLGRVQAAVTCLPRLPLPLLGPVALLPALPPPGAPAPVPPVLNPLPAAQVQTQVQAQIQPQLMAQQQERTAANLALALNLPEADAPETVTVLPMSRRKDVPTPAYLGALAALTAGATVVAVRRREPVQVPVTVRRSPG
ncbi:MAG: Integrin beta chain domain [Actinomycetota bacterium]|jgi:hypothetical protein|nr:Integrin beta chain domain [Actinomycetota bacterium]